MLTLNPKYYISLITLYHTHWRWLVLLFHLALKELFYHLSVMISILATSAKYRNARFKKALILPVSSLLRKGPHPGRAYNILLT